MGNKLRGKIAVIIGGASGIGIYKEIRHILLKENGRIAAVLPITTFTGPAFHPLVRYLVSHYQIETIIIGLGRSSFSEITWLTECLFVACKKNTVPDHRFKLVGLWERPEKWNEHTLTHIAEMITEDNNIGIVREIPQTELLPENSALSGLVLRLNLFSMLRNI
jgi:hypothetical protein